MDTSGARARAGARAGRVAVPERSGGLPRPGRPAAGRRAGAPGPGDQRRSRACTCET